MPNNNNLEQKINKIESRNKKVESDKAWEISFSRKLVIFILTYLAISIFLWAIKIEKPFLNAIVPAIAFMLSTLTMPYFKKAWIKYIYKK